MSKVVWQETFQQSFGPNNAETFSTTVQIAGDDLLSINPEFYFQGSYSATGIFNASGSFGPYPIQNGGTSGSIPLADGYSLYFEVTNFKYDSGTDEGSADLTLYLQQGSEPPVPLCQNQHITFNTKS